MFYKIILLTLLPLMGCTKTKSSIPEIPLTPVSKMPRSVVFDKGADKHFSLNTSQKRYGVDVENTGTGYGHGTTHQVFADLDETNSGRRKLVYSNPDPDNPCELTIANSDWNLPPVTVRGMNDEIMTCWNHLNGQAVLDAMPHPTEGVDIHCAVLSQDCKFMVEEFKVETPHLVSWLKDVSAKSSGNFRVIFYVDDGWLTVPGESYHGTYAFDFDGTSFSKPILVQAACGNEG